MALVSRRFVKFLVQCLTRFLDDRRPSSTRNCSQRSCAAGVRSRSNAPACKVSGHLSLCTSACVARTRFPDALATKLHFQLSLWGVELYEENGSLVLPLTRLFTFQHGHQRMDPIDHDQFVVGDDGLCARFPVEVCEFGAA